MFMIQTLLEKVVLPESLVLELDIDQDTQQLARQYIAIAIDISINDIIKPVLDWSVTNSLETTKQMILKDFIYETDAEKIMSAAECLASNLTRNLAMITCKEPLRIQVYQNLYSVFI